MNWDAIGAIGSILGAVAVVVSIVYLALQFRDQNKEAKLSAQRDILTAFREGYLRFSDGEIADIFVRGNEDFAALSETEKARLVVCVNVLLRVLEEAYEKHRNGTFDDQLWDAMVKQYAFFMSAPSLAEVWRQRRVHFTDEFRDFVDNLEKHTYVIA